MPSGTPAAPGFADLFSIEGTTEEPWRAPAMPLADETPLFGGVLIAQAVVAVSRAAPRCHSLHVYFVAMGVNGEAFDIRTERVRDGGSFATRRIETRQSGRLLLAGHSSHHDGDPGTDLHASLPPGLPAPETLPEAGARRNAAQDAGKPWRPHLTQALMDVRPVDLAGAAAGSVAQRAVWFRMRPALGVADPALRRAAIGFASDAGLVHAGILAHRNAGGGRVQAASLDHAIWFHREADPDGWMIQFQQATTLAHGRGMSHTQIFARDGTLVASAAQEILVRDVRPSR